MKADLMALVAASLLVFGAGAATGQGVAGYGAPTLASDDTADYQHISQMAFRPGDAGHLYAIRFAFGDSSGTLTRYDFSPTTGRISNPVNLVSAGLPAAEGLAFHGNDLYISTSDQKTGMGGLMRLAGQPDGSLSAPVEFVNNVPIGLHQIDHIQVVGNSLYVGIGTQTDAGTFGKESVYNGTVGFIADLRKANASAAGSDNLALADVLNSTDPGKLRVFASGFRNPYGLRVTGNGQLWVSDEGRDDPVSPDYLYKNVTLGSKGLFPTQNPGTPISALATLGDHSSGTGFDFIPAGPDAGKALIGLFHVNTDPNIPVTGNDLAMVNATTGGVSQAYAGPTSVTDVLADPNSGRILIADYGPNFDNGYNPASGGIYGLSAVPEPASVSLLLAGGLLVGLIGRRRLRRRRSH